MTNNPTIKILIGYHKPAQLIKDDIFTPIHCGRAVATSTSKDGVISGADHQWMLDNMIGDDTGDNISNLNRYFNEMTAIYWAWKNYDSLGNPDYIGFNHYRRIFAFNYKKKSNFQLKETDIKRVLSSDIISANFWHPQGGIYQHYLEASAGGHNIKFFDSALEIIRSQDEKKHQEIQQLIHQNEAGGFCNMFIMKKELFFEYCEWVFGILLPLYDKHKNHQYAQYENRNIAWTAERLTSLWLYFAEKKYDLQQLPVHNPENGIPETSTLKKLIYKLLYKITFGKTRKKYKEKYKRIKVK